MILRTDFGKPTINSSFTFHFGNFSFLVKNPGSHLLSTQSQLPTRPKTKNYDIFVVRPPQTTTPVPSGVPPHTGLPSSLGFLRSPSTEAVRSRNRCNRPVFLSRIPAISNNTIAWA
ncbi:hypothetical protein RchiOBHm_Chr7g0235011 [Rosa chinensis]|uniref:Uncharacterized protein n=1 Tax=Rosa chinensis TaxID=74649 RepID=A0A2P6PGK2_ROSCH|nr:hypothetical protein RchiOBHm_Chr7g0235011 [Rosa chinensis]